MKGNIFLVKPRNTQQNTAIQEITGSVASNAKEHCKTTLRKEHDDRMYRGGE
jgi:hypothetical protein